jgi:hypothetical protein
MLALLLFLIYFVFLCLILANLQQNAWWVKVVTHQPKCTYYFGPFNSQEEATASKQGYLQDLEAEGAQKIHVNIQQARPRKLTIFHDLA